jgi:phosphohistidine phosphatase
MIGSCSKGMDVVNHLYLLRHGIAVPHGTIDMRDDDRPLTPKGEKRMRQIGRGLRRLALNVDQIVTSPLPRARRTAEIVAEALGHPDRLEDSDALRPDRPAEMIRDWLAGRPSQNLMLVGHNPNLSELAWLLVAGEHAPLIGELKKGGLAALVAGPEADFQLDWLATPRLLRRLAYGRVPHGK